VQYLYHKLVSVIHSTNSQKSQHYLQFRHSPLVLFLTYNDSCKCPVKGFFPLFIPLR
jgi:hypothetical protein